MTEREIAILKANIIGGMNAYILEVLGDEEVTECWQKYGVPDGTTEDELMEDIDDCFEDWVTLFANCIS